MARFGQGPRSCFYSVGSFCRYPTFLLARPSTRCIVLALDAPGLTRRPNKRPAKWAPVRMLLRSLAHYTVLHVKPLAARAAMINLPNLQLTGNSALAKRASVNKLFGSDMSVFDLKFSLRRLRLTQGRQDTPSPKYENNIPWTATEIPDINTFDSLSHNLCLRYLDLQKLYNICTFGLLHMWAVLTFPRRSALKMGSAAPGR